MQSPDAVEIEFPARSENISVAREAVVAHARRLGMSDSSLSDLRTVVSEAFTNAVLYAYEDGEEGSIELVVAKDRDALSVTVRDFGAGIFPRLERDGPSLNMGLSIIGTLSRGFNLYTRRGQGTELKICVPI